LIITSAGLVAISLAIVERRIVLTLRRGCSSPRIVRSEAAGPCVHA
jgi:hypothetical protein